MRDSRRKRENQQITPRNKWRVKEIIASLDDMCLTLRERQ